MAENKLEVDGALALRVIWLTSPAVIDEPKLRELFGELETQSFDGVAQAFGVPSATVKHTWRRDGMPALETRRGVGSRVVLVDVLLWLLKRDAANKIARGSSDNGDRKKAAETRAAEAEARIKERKAEVIEGEHVPKSLPIAAIRARANLLRDIIMGIPERMRPTFPAEHAQEYTERLEKYLRDALVAFSESSISDVEEISNERDSDGL